MNNYDPFLFFFLYRNGKLIVLCLQKLYTDLFYDYRNCILILLKYVYKNCNEQGC